MAVSQTILGFEQDAKRWGQSYAIIWCGIPRREFIFEAEQFVFMIPFFVVTYYVAGIVVLVVYWRFWRAHGPKIWGVLFTLFVVISMCLPAVFSKWLMASDGMKSAAAMAQVSDLARLTNEYLESNGGWPSGATQGDIVYGAGSQKEMIRILTARRTNGSPWVAFSRQVLKDGEVCDFWGKPLNVVIDTDGDGNCKSERLGLVKGQRCLVWTDGAGPVCSWLIGNKQ